MHRLSEICRARKLSPILPAITPELGPLLGFSAVDTKHGLHLYHLASRENQVAESGDTRQIPGFARNTLLRPTEPLLFPDR